MKPQTQLSSPKTTTEDDVDHKGRLALWLDKLPKYTLPLNQAIASKTLRTLEDANSTAEQLASLVQQDPVLCLSLFLTAKRQLQARNGDIQGLVHLIGLLGLDQIKHTINRAKKEQKPCQGRRELLAASLFSAHLALYLLPEKHGTRGERFFLPSLLFNAPLWLMWMAAPKLMEKAQVLASKKNRPLEPLCVKALGFSLHDLLDRTPSFLALPTLSVKALAIDFHQDMRLWAKIRQSRPSELASWFEKDKQAKQLFGSAETGLHLINHYVLAIYLDWHGKHIQRWTTLLARHLKIPELDLTHKVADIAARMELPDYLKGDVAPLYRYRAMHRSDAKQQSAADTRGNLNIIRQYLKQLRDTNNLGHCLQLAMEAMKTGAEVEHCFILKVVNKHHLEVPLCYGFTHNQLSSINIAYHDCGQVFKQLLNKPMALSVDKAKVPQIESRLPLALLKYWNPIPCGLMSLFHNGEPYAIVVCDHRDWNQERHKQFIAIGKQLSHTLKQCINP
ncbi:MAG: HDOD domain-containing protein [Pseudomonadota bacterium]